MIDFKNNWNLWLMAGLLVVASLIFSSNSVFMSDLKGASFLETSNTNYNFVYTDYSKQLQTIDVNSKELVLLGEAYVDLNQISFLSKNLNISFRIDSKQYNNLDAPIVMTTDFVNYTEFTNSDSDYYDVDLYGLKSDKVYFLTLKSLINNFNSDVQINWFNNFGYSNSFTLKTFLSASI